MRKSQAIQRRKQRKAKRQMQIHCLHEGFHSSTDRLNRLTLFDSVSGEYSLENGTMIDPRSPDCPLSIFRVGS